MISRTADRKRRLEASVEAVAAERRNRPVALVAVAAAVLIAASAFAIYASSQRAKARSGMRGAEYTMQRLVNLREEIDAYQNSDAQRELQRQYAPMMRNIRSRLEHIADSLNIEKRALQLGQISDRRMLGLDSPLLLRTIEATINEGEIEQTLEWMQAVTDQIDGIFVSGVTLNPAADGWRVNVRFSRWEIEQ